MDYILIIPDNAFEVLEEKCKKLGYGVRLFKNKDEMYIQYKGTHRLDIIRNKETMHYTVGENFRVEPGDLICLHIKRGKDITDHSIQL